MGPARLGDPEASGARGVRRGGTSLGRGAGPRERGPSGGAREEAVRMRTRLVVQLVGVFAAGFLFALIVQVRTPGGPMAPAVSPGARPESNGAAAAPSQGALPEGLTPEEGRNIEIFRHASPSVVNIVTIALQRDFFSL